MAHAGEPRGEVRSRPQGVFRRFVVSSEQSLDEQYHQQQGIALQCYMQECARKSFNFQMREFCLKLRAQVKLNKPDSEIQDSIENMMEQVCIVSLLSLKLF